MYKPNPEDGILELHFFKIPDPEIEKSISGLQSPFFTDDSSTTYRHVVIICRSSVAGHWTKDYISPSTTAAAVSLCVCLCV